MIRCIAFILLFQQSFAIFKCPQGSVDEFYGDPDDCTQFHRCYEGTRHATFSCPPGTFYDERTISCDHSYKVKCQTDKYGDGSNPNRFTVKPPTDVLVGNSDLDPLLWRNTGGQPQSSSQLQGYYNFSRASQYRQLPQSSETWTPAKSHEIWKPKPTFSSRNDNFQRNEALQRYNPGDYRRQYTQSPQLREKWTTPKSHLIWKPSPTFPPKYGDSRNVYQQKETVQRYSPGDYSRSREPDSRAGNRYPSVGQTNYGYNQPKPTYDYNQPKPTFDYNQPKPTYGYSPRRPSYDSYPSIPRPTQGYQYSYYTTGPEGTYQSRGNVQSSYHYKEPETDRKYQRPYEARSTQKPGYDIQYQKPPQSEPNQQKQNPYPQRNDYDGSDNQFPGSQTRYGDTRNRRPEYDTRRYPQEYQTTKTYQYPSANEFQDRNQRKENRPDIYRDTFQVVTRSPYTGNVKPDNSRRDYERDWSQRQPSSQTRRPYQSGYDGRQPRREKEFEDWFTTKGYTNIESDLSNLQNLSKSNYDTLYQLCLRLYPQLEANSEYNYKRGSEREFQIRPDKQHICEQFSPSRQQDSNQLPDYPLNWPKIVTPPSYKEQHHKESSKPISQSKVDVEPDSRKTQTHNPNYYYDPLRDKTNVQVTKSPWRLPKHQQHYPQSERDAYNRQQNIRRQTYYETTKSPFKPPYQHHIPIDSQRKGDQWSNYERRGDLYVSSSNTNSRLPNDNITDDASNLIPNEDPFAIHNLISNLRCEDTHLQDCEDCETLSYLKFPKVLLKSPFFESHILRIQTVEKECFQLCLEKNCIAYSYSNKSGNCSLYFSDVSGYSVAINKDYSTVIVEPKIAILKEEWVITSPATPAGKPMAVISTDNSIKCLEMCYQIGEQCKGVGYDFNTKICKFYDGLNAKKIALKSNTIAIQYKNISEFDDELASDPYSRIRPDRQQICVKFNPSRKTQERNQMQNLPPQALKLVDNSTEQYSDRPYPPSADLRREPHHNRPPYIYTESNPFQTMPESRDGITDYGRGNYGSQTRGPYHSEYDVRQPRREKEFEEWFPTTTKIPKREKQNDTLYDFCLQLYSKVQTTPTYSESQGNYQQSIVRLEKQHICDQFNPNRQRQQRKQIPESASQRLSYTTEAPTEERKDRFETYPKEPFKPMGHLENVYIRPDSKTTQQPYSESKTTQPYSEPIKTWWSWDDDPVKAGRCGVGAPKINGVFPTCDPNSRSSFCCGYTGYCGSGAAFCDCTLCVNFKKNPNFRW